MNSLIKSLDEFHPEERVEKLKRNKFNTYVNKINAIYDKNYFNLYENHFKPYIDLDKCNEGFLKSTQKRLKIHKKKITISAEIKSISDLIKLTNDYPMYDDIEYNINIQGIHRIKDYLIRLDAMIGLEELKQSILDQIIYFIHEKDDDYLHTVLYGPPGTGKTEVATILGKIYTKLGILENGTFVKVTRSDFIAGYLGQTALKTRKLVEENLGGVIFIDEAYAMGNQEKRDSFSKEALDTLCELLSDHKRDLMVIIAGYKEELDKCFFSYNPGLESRFAWQFDLRKYTPLELSLIFKKKVLDADWKLGKNVGNVEWFEKNKDHFKNYGRDIENLFSKTKICHFRRVFGKFKTRYILINEDLDNGLKKFINHNSSNDIETKPNFMYT